MRLPSYNFDSHFDLLMPNGFAPSKLKATTSFSHKDREVYLHFSKLREQAADNPKELKKLALRQSMYEITQILIERVRLTKRPVKRIFPVIDRKPKKYFRKVRLIHNSILLRRAVSQHYMILQQPIRKIPDNGIMTMKLEVFDANGPLEPHITASNNEIRAALRVPDRNEIIQPKTNSDGKESSTQEN